MTEGRTHRDVPDGTGLFVLLCVINLLNYIDRNVVAGLLEPIRRDFGATDAQMGLVGVAFTLTYTVLPSFFGWLGDRIPRTAIIGASVAFWSVATAATALAARVWQLVVTRAAVGVGEASYMANSPSLIMDLFVPEKRGRAMSVFYVASPVGAALGVALGGLLWPHFGWRGACAIVGLPGLVAAALIVRQWEPTRGRFDVDRRPAVVPSFVAVLRYLSRNRVYITLILAYGGLVFTQNAIELWLPTVLQRDKHIPVAEANATYGAVVLAAGITGPLLGAACGDWLRRRDPRGYYQVAAMAAGFAVLPLLGIVWSVSRVPLFASVFGEALLGNASIGIIIMLIVAAVVPEVRATATAVALTSVHLIGDVISQPLVGSLSTVLERSSPNAPLWGVLAPLGLTSEQHLSVALIAVGTAGSLAAAALFVIGGRVAHPRT